MTHDDFREFIQRELDEDLSPEESKLLEAHVITCAECCQEREEYQKLVNGLAKLSEVMPERSFVSQMMPDLPNLSKPEQQASSTPLQTNKRKTASWMRGLSVAAVVVLAVGFATHWQFLLGGSKGSGQVADNHVTGQSQAKPSDNQTAQAPAKNADAQTTSPKTPDVAGVTNYGSVSKTGTVSGDSQESTANSHPLLADSTQETEKLSKSPNLSKSETIQTDRPTTQTSAASSGNQAGNVGSTAGALQGVTTDNNGLQPVLTGSGSSASAGMGGPIKSHLGGSGRTVGTGNPGLTAGSVPAPFAIVGPVQNPPADLNPQLQANVKSGQATWATNPTEVVERHLTALGFSQTADVLSTPELGRVQVIQGEVFMVTLTQPFEQDQQGIWVPAQISRIVNQQNPDGPDKPILQYFDQLKTSGTIVDFGNLEILQNTSTQVVVKATVVQKSKSGGTTVSLKLYVCPVAQQADGSWLLNGTPQLK